MRSSSHRSFHSLTPRASSRYDPIFQAPLLSEGEGEGEGARAFEASSPRLVWRRRHYRVRRKPKAPPGRFIFTVLDSGVLSYEDWRIVDCASDLSWALLYYAGAAAAAGQAYSGAVFVTPDGRWPSGPEAGTDRIEGAHALCGIKLWESFEVVNDCDFPEELVESDAGEQALAQAMEQATN